MTGALLPTQFDATEALPKFVPAQIRVPGTVVFRGRTALAICQSKLVPFGAKPATAKVVSSRFLASVRFAVPECACTDARN
ncbi:MAG: hypothetical protein FD129_2999 [bacterium]|nr:MAG: hypothetical protein FD129_2999 [bacterium]